MCVIAFLVMIMYLYAKCVRAPAHVCLFPPCARVCLQCVCVRVCVRVPSLCN